MAMSTDKELRETVIRLMLENGLGPDAPFFGTYAEFVNVVGAIYCAGLTAGINLSIEAIQEAAES